MTYGSRLTNQSSTVKFNDAEDVRGTLAKHTLVVASINLVTMSSLLQIRGLKHGHTFSSSSIPFFDHNDGDVLEILVKSIDDSLLVLKQH
ncbi:uncharacterized protein G2W53_003358 [Senna tora]|uniref:Uncharacterized protein n=1 Tax=Senna tora TaxID=362788 RepID=A0A834XA27_9FABA|nr:uncharacterized protein G2W53_003358 [Senna tora]